VYLLDTNVVSELRRKRPHGAVVAWFAARRDAKAWLPAVAIGELQQGIELTRRQDSAKADEIERWLDRVVLDFDVLPMDRVCFREWARMMEGKSDDLSRDAMIAATARVHGLKVVTRNERDFASFDVPIVDPFA
jgi:toxin FitB